ncbi:glycosyltransferase, MSMEG_0565 family [Kocuria rosea]|uniref:glycosyltransferase family 4 protein n=1 Tax=Kocuria rosea TaxID=1275 RepID=UPI000F6BF731|nr:glycosyltransferase family 4 protein [Kocuria rosea]VEH41909.1 glycosyltransferase, MSMEG_0565 family [Kocuria rosea]
MSTARAGIDVVVPDDGGRPTGGSLYDRRLVAALDALGRPARLVPVAGCWPAPDGAARARLRRALGAPAPGRAVVLDCLVGCAAPEAVDDAVRSGVPVHLLVHLPLPAETGLDPAAATELARREAAALTAATGVLAPSAWAARDLLRRYGTADAVVAEPGAERGPVAAGSRPPQLTCLASLTPRKNQGLLLEALAPLTALGWTLDLVGPEGGPEHVRTLRAAVRDLPDPGRVRCPGPLEGAALARQWARTDLLLLPSTTETYGMVVTEALAHGVPAVVAAGTGAVEALDGTPGPRGAPDTGVPSGAGLRAGAALDPTDPSAWTAVLRDWLTDPALRAQWRAAALARRDRLRSWTDTARDVLAAIGPHLDPAFDPSFDPSDALGRSPDHDPDRTRRPS